MTLRRYHCETCHWWTERASPLATAERNPLARPGIGICRYSPPKAVVLAGVRASILPETTAGHSCNAWDPIDLHDNDPGSGSRVVPFERPAA